MRPTIPYLLVRRVGEGVSNIECFRCCLQVSAPRRKFTYCLHTAHSPASEYTQVHDHKWLKRVALITCKNWIHMQVQFQGILHLVFVYLTTTSQIYVRPHSLYHQLVGWNYWMSKAVKISERGQPLKTRTEIYRDCLIAACTTWKGHCIERKLLLNWALKIQQCWVFETDNREVYTQRVISTWCIVAFFFRRWFDGKRTTKQVKREMHKADISRKCILLVQRT